MRELFMRCALSLRAGAVCLLAIAPGRSAAAGDASARDYSAISCTTGRSGSPILGAVVIGENPSQPVIDERTGRAFVAGNHNRSMMGTVYALDTCTGRLVQTIPMSWMVQSTALDTHAGHLFVVHAPPFSEGSGRVTVLDTASGAIVRTLSLASGRTVLSPVGEAAVAETTGRVFVPDECYPSIAGGPDCPGTVSVLNAANGQLVRTVTVGDLPQLMAVDAQTGRVFVVTVRSDLSARVGVLDARSGRLLHTVAVGSSVGSIAADEGTGHVFIVTGNGYVTILDARSGQRLGAVPVGGVLSDIVIAAPMHHAFIGDESGTVHMLDTATGAVLRHVKVCRTSAVAQAIDERRGRVFVVCLSMTDLRAMRRGPGHVSILDASTAAVLQTITLGHTPNHIAIDDQTGLAFVVDGDAGTVTALGANFGGSGNR